MKATPLTLTLAAALAMGAAAPAAAQYVDPQTEQEYRQQVDEYNETQREYEQQRRSYEEGRRDWENERAGYDRQRQDWLRAQADYDVRYGRGAYERKYGVFAYRQDWADNYYYDNRYRGYADNRDRNDRYRNDDYYRGYRDSPCERRSSGNRAAGTIIGAIAGAAIGSNLDDDGNRAEGTVLGAIVGGAIGNNVAGSSRSARCDNVGYYYTYEQTYPYRERGGYRGYRSGRYDTTYYNRRRCRLAVAPAYYSGRTDYRYVRVCPDRRGRYRITN